MSTLQLLRYAAFLRDFVIMIFSIFPVDSCTLLNRDSLDSPTSTHRLLHSGCGMCVCCVCYCALFFLWLPLWAGLGGSCLSIFKVIHSPYHHRLIDSSTHRLIDSSTHRLFDSSNSFEFIMFVCPFCFGRPSGWVCGMGFFVNQFKVF